MAPRVIKSCPAVRRSRLLGSIGECGRAWKGSTARPEPVTDYSQLGFLVGCDASPNGPLRRDESRGYAGNLFRVSRRIHDIADAMAGRGQASETLQRPRS